MAIRIHFGSWLANDRCFPAARANCRRGLAALCCMILTGCVASTDQERHAALEANRHLFTGNPQTVGLATYHLLSFNTDLESIVVEPKTGKFSLKWGADRHFSEALCVGIDGGGYILTAAHAVGNFCYVLGEMEGRYQVRRARVVKKQTADSPERDFAVLKVAATVNSLPYAPEVSRGQPVFAVVLIRFGEMGGGMEDTAGRVLDIQPEPLGHGPKVIYCSVPARAGDSGGPLVDAAGKLLGITVGGQVLWEGLGLKHQSSTCRPEWQVLSQIIEDDRRAQASDGMQK